MKIIFAIVALLAITGCVSNQYDSTGCDYRDPMCDSHNGYLGSGGHNQG